MNRMHQVIWTLADLFRKEAPAGWGPHYVEFQRDLETIRVAGAQWSVRTSVRTSAGSHEEFDAAVVIEPRDSSQGVPERRQKELLRFMKSAERKMRLRRYAGSFNIDSHIGRHSGSLHFRKHLTTVDEVRSELVALESLRFEQRKRPGAKPEKEHDDEDNKDKDDAGSRPQADPRGDL